MCIHETVWRGGVAAGVGSVTSSVEKRSQNEAIRTRRNRIFRLDNADFGFKESSKRSHFNPLNHPRHLAGFINSAHLPRHLGVHLHPVYHVRNFQG